MCKANFAHAQTWQTYTQIGCLRLNDLRLYVMKRFGPCLLLVLTLVLSVIPSANAAVTAGAKCSKAGSKEVYKGKTFTCIKSGQKLVWDKGAKVETYDAAFAAAILWEAQIEADQILADAELRASQISSPPNCGGNNSKALVSIGGDPSTGVIALIYENPGICELVVRASAEFSCPRGKPGNNTVISRGTITLKSRAKLYVSLNPARYFPLVTLECAVLTGYTSNSISVANELTRRTEPRVTVESSKYSGAFNQAEATKRAKEILKSAQSQADRVIADAKNPVVIAKAWDVQVKKIAKALDEQAKKIAADAVAKAEAEKWDFFFQGQAAAAKIESDKAAKIAAEKAAAEKVIAEKTAADKAAAEKVAADKAAAEKAAAEKVAADKATADKAAAEKIARECAPVNCPLVGSIGPGGGVVFYDAGSYQSWGRYLEFAPNGWSGNKNDPEAIWCNVTNVNFLDLISDITLRASVGDEIGKGKANTDLMLAGCTSGAGNLANAYKGGGKKDWYLPSRNELNELCKFVLNNPRNDGSLNWKSDKACQTNTTLLAGFLQTTYWSSSEGVFDFLYKRPGVWTLHLSAPPAGGSPKLSHSAIVGKDGSSNRLRPIRAF